MDTQQSERKPQQVWEVRAGWEAYFCESPEYADLVINEIRRRNKVIGATDGITVEEVTVYGGIPQWELDFVHHLAQWMSEE